MYKLYFFLFCAVLFASCGKKYRIEGVSSVSLLDGKMLFIKVPDMRRLIIRVSSAVILSSRKNSSLILLRLNFIEISLRIPLALAMGRSSVPPLVLCNQITLAAFQ